MVDWLIRITAFVLLSALLVAFAGKIEGYFWPVVGDMQITRSEEAPNGYTRIWGGFTIYRERCDFAGIEWKHKGVSRDSVVDVVFDRTQERSGGAQEYGPWLVQLSPVNLIEDRSYAVVFHDCFSPFWRRAFGVRFDFAPWLTETHFYP